MKNTFTQEQLQFMKDNYKSMTWTQMATTSLFKDIKNARQIRDRANNMGLKKDKKQQFNENFFENIDTEEKAYWLGFIYADGYITKNTRGNTLGFTLHQQDRELLVRFNQCLEGNVQVKDKERTGTSIAGGKAYTSTRKQSTIRFFSKKLIHDLVDKGIVQNKTYEKQYPKLNSLREDLKIHYTRGFFDGDGCLYTKDKKVVVSFTNANKPMLEEIHNYLRENNIVIGGNVYTEKETKHKLMYAREDSINLCNIMYEQSTLHLSRKYNKYKQIFL